MAGGLCSLNQFRCLAEIGVGAGGINQRADFALTDDRAGKYCFAGFAFGWQRLSRQCGLIHFYRVPLQQPRIRRHDVAKTDANDVARDQLTRRRGNPLPSRFTLALIASVAFKAAIALPA